MKVKRKIIEIDEELCDGCGNCVTSCAEGALAVINGKARVVKEEFCDGLGACIGECPTGALRIVEREAEEFDEDAVERHLIEKEEETGKEDFMPASCPSANIETFKPSVDSDTNHSEDRQSKSYLSHWPVQINLIPSGASFLKGADLLIVADCVPVSYPDFHQDFLKDRVVMIGCPKFDNAETYVQKFAEIFKQAGIKRITAVMMEVPCCFALPVIIKKGIKRSGKQIPMEQITISNRGKILDRRKVA